MKLKGSEHGYIGPKRVCGGITYAIGSPDQGAKRVPSECGRWDCEKCGKRLREKWFRKIDEKMPGAVLYAVDTKRRGEELYERVRKNLDRKQFYICLHLVGGGAIVFSNAKFAGGKAKNRIKFLGKVEELMESCRVQRVSSRQDEQKESTHKKLPRWSYATFDKDIMDEYRKCRSDFEVGKLIMEHLGSDMVRRVTTLGWLLLEKIKVGEINEDAPDW